MNFSRPVACIASFSAVSTASVPLFAKCVRVGDFTGTGRAEIAMLVVYGIAAAYMLSNQNAASAL